MDDQDWPDLDKPTFNAKEVLRWIEGQSPDRQIEITEDIFQEFLGRATQPKPASGKPCIKLCNFVEQCSKSSSPAARDFSLLPSTVLGLFNFYLERSESEQQRSMKHVLDLLPVLIARNASLEAPSTIKPVALDKLLEIISGRSTKPLIKSAIKALNFLFNKHIFSLDEIIQSYKNVTQSSLPGLFLWKAFLVELFDWMKLQHISLQAGKLIADVYRALRKQPDGERLGEREWHEWLLEVLSASPKLLEPIKTHVFVPIFKEDRQTSLAFLSEVMRTSSAFQTQDLGVSAFFQLALLEVGKNHGIVEEPGHHTGAVAQSESVVMDEGMLRSVLAHASSDIRSIALSLVMSSPSTVKPYSPITLNILKCHLGSIFADVDPKLRTNTLGKIKDMFNRLRGATSVIQKSIVRAQAAALKSAAGSPSVSGNDQAPGPSLFKTSIISLPEAELQQLLAEHQDFLQWFLNFLKAELVPTASYPRHITAVKATLHAIALETDGKKEWSSNEDDELFYDAFDPAWIRALLDLVLDPYEDVRDASASILGLIFSDSRFGRVLINGPEEIETVTDLLTSFLARAEDVFRLTGRSDKADGVARAYGLLYHSQKTQARRIWVVEDLTTALEIKLDMADQDPALALSEAPVHGNFSSLCYVWHALSSTEFLPLELEQISRLQTRLANCCHRIWAFVRDVLCDDTQEGHLPQGVDDEEGLDTKDVLSYSFRAVQEASNLMRAIITCIENRTQPDTVCPTIELFEAMGYLAFEQILTIRHRGALTKVSTTFAASCQLSTALDGVLENRADEETLLGWWYKGTLACIFGQISTTRRSAGIPAAVVGILMANGKYPSFDQVLDDLIEIAQRPASTTQADGIALPQVHALNCLKAIFHSSAISRLGNPDEYLPRCFELAATCMKSSVWAIRNCGLILLRGLIDSLLGTSESKDAGWQGRSTGILYHNYPTLPGVLLSLHEAGLEAAGLAAASTAAESVFPALDIIRRAGPPEEFRDELYSCTAKYLASPVWHVRDIAARTLCSYLLHPGWLDAVEDIIRDSAAVVGPNRRNAVHGAFLLLKSIIQKLHDTMPALLAEDIGRLKGVLGQLATNLEEGRIEHPDVLATFIEILNLASNIGISHGGPEGLKDWDIGVDLREMPEAPGTCPLTALLRARLGTRRVYEILGLDSIRGIKSPLCEAAETSPETCTLMLETMSEVIGTGRNSEEAFILCHIYRSVCLRTKVASVQATALQNLAGVVDYLLDGCEVYGLPRGFSFTELWTRLQSGRMNMNPNLANAIVRVSGPILASLFLQKEETRDLSSAVLGWGVMMADAGLYDKPFESRISVAQSLKSFFNAVDADAEVAGHLRPLLALYDAMNDDDDEVREVAAQGAKRILGRNLAAIEAAERLLEWLTERFGDDEVFQTAVACRMVGQTSGSGILAADVREIEPVNEKLAAAMKFDDSLFAVEEQNLYIDEVRETQRWKRVFSSLSWDPAAERFDLPRRWAASGLRALIELAKREDGPLGWTSQPAVFAVCSRIMLSGVAFGGTGHCPEMEGLLGRLGEVGRESQLHGLLLGLLDEK